MVQRKAARFVFNDFSSYSSVSSMLTKLNWQSLEQRRTKAIIIMFYKIINNLADLNQLFPTFPFKNLMYASSFQ